MNLQVFLSDKQGRTFTDVVNDNRLPFQRILDFFSDPIRQQRMIDSELHHDRPALAGVIREFEADPVIHNFFANHDGHTTIRHRQSVGVIVRMIMEQRGWTKANKKGSLGTRTKVIPHTVTLGAYHNTGGLSLWFTRAERYTCENIPFTSVLEMATKLSGSNNDEETEKSTSE